MKIRPSFSRGKASLISSSSEVISNLEKHIRKVFDHDLIRDLARKTGFLQRQSKLKPLDFLTTLMFSQQDHSHLSLQDCCNDLFINKRLSISKVGFHKKFNERTLDFIKAVMGSQLAEKINTGDSKRWASFTRVLLTESTKFSMPEQYKEAYPSMGGCRGSRALMNIQYAFDIKHGSWDKLEFTKATQNDQGYSARTAEDILPGELHLRDLGYVTQTYLRQV